MSRKKNTFLSSFSKRSRVALALAALLVFVTAGYSVWWLATTHTAIFARNREQQVSPPVLPVVGEIVPFGAYYWRVLELDMPRGRMLLLSEYVIDTRSYDATGVGETWEGSTVRRHLNNAFVNSFAEEYRARILHTYVVNSGNPWFGTYGGNNTYDRVFLLSLEEVVQYFGDSGQLHNRENGDWRIHDQYNPARIARNTDGVAVWWWLRTPGLTEEHAINIGFADGYVLVDGMPSVEFGGVRPAMWVNLQ